jgi:hypothetical protein
MLWPHRRLSHGAPAHGRHDAVGVERMTTELPFPRPNGPWGVANWVTAAMIRRQVVARFIIPSERRQCLRGILPAQSSVTSEALSVQAKGGALFTLMRARDLEVSLRSG